MAFLSFIKVFVNLKQSFLAHVTGTNRTRTATFSTPVPVSTCHDAQLSVASFSFVNPSTFNMKTMLRKTILFALAFMLANLLFLTQAGAQQLSNVGPATVTSDKDDYPPMSLAMFTGGGFTPGETVILRVKNLNRACNTVTADSSYMPWSVRADGNGSFVTNWTVCDCPGDSLRLSAKGQSSGYIAYAYFTDAPVTISPASLGTNISADRA
ncbi:MAG TPA: hypothetical protein VEY51_10645, partial [Chondromyces sp.]|nr:hypothetical protein [Chondromyces sp.]